MADATQDFEARPLEAANVTGPSRVGQKVTH
jgi:hypothetical protein